MRRKSRESAIQILYQIDVRRNPDDAEIEVLIRDHFEHFTSASTDERAYAEMLVHGTIEHVEAIDDALNAASHNWRLSRMGGVDRNILRVAAYEILYCPEVPAAVTMDEAVEIARKFVSGDAASFINGILDRINKTKEGAENNE